MYGVDEQESATTDWNPARASHRTIQRAAMKAMIQGQNPSCTKKIKIYEWHRLFFVFFLNFGYFD